jgi:hypothetical protein
MAQDQDLHILRSGIPGKQPKPAEHRDRDQVQQSKQHDQRSWPDRWYHGKLQVTAQMASFGTVHALTGLLDRFSRGWPNELIFEEAIGSALA